MHSLDRIVDLIAFVAGSTSAKSQTECSLTNLEVLSHSVVADTGKAELGNKKIKFAKGEMQGLLAALEEYGETEPLKGARISCSFHTTARTGVLIEVLVALGAEVRWCSCDISGTEDHPAAAMAAAGVPVFAWKGQSLEEYWWCMYQCLSWPSGNGVPNMIIDNGGYATKLVHEGVKAEAQFKKNNSLPDPSTTKDPNFKIMFSLLRNSIQKDPTKFTRMVSALAGVIEGTTIGAHRLQKMAKDGALRFPVMNISSSLTKNKFDTKYGCRHSIQDGIMRATDVMICGKRVLVCGFGDVGKGCAQSIKAAGARVFVAEIDPICALQALMDGMNIKTLEEVISDIDIVVTATGNKGVVSASDMAKMKNNCIVANIGNFEGEIDVPGLARIPGIKKKMIKPEVHRWQFPDGHGVIVLAEGHLLNLECATGHPSLVMSCICTNQVLALNELFNGSKAKTKKGKYSNQVHLFPKALDEKVARLHVDKFGGMLTELSKEQADYIGVPVNGPYKPVDYRY